MVVYSVIAFLTAGAHLLPAGSAVAEDRFGDSPAPRGRGDGPTLDKLIEGLPKGKLLDAHVKGRKYVVKLLDENGRVKTFEVDAPSGGGVGGDITIGRSGGGGGAGGGGGGGGPSGGGGGGPGGGGGGSPGGGGPGGGGGGGPGGGGGGPRR